MNRRQFLVATLGAILLPPARLFAQNHFPGEEVFDDLARKSLAKGWQNLPIGMIVGAVGMELLGTPYVGFTLEVSSDEEPLVVNLAGLDCVTFYEVCLAFARSVRLNRLTHDEFKHQIEIARYRGGRRQGYVSRLHYTSDWFADNDRRKIVSVLTPSLPGAALYQKQIDFMSKHPASYRQLAAHKDLVPRIASLEKGFAKRVLFYVPKDSVAQAETRLQTGDIIGFTTSAEGLDTSHTGLCYSDRGVIRLLHASSAKKQVVLDAELSEYLSKVPKDTGIMVARPLEPHP